MARQRGGMMPDDLSPDQLSLIVRLYGDQSWSVDWLPYTQEFEVILARLQSAGLDISRRDLARLLIRLRKDARRLLPKKGSVSRGDSPFDRVHEARLMLLYAASGETTDFLAYTPQFDRIAAEFRRQTCRDWSDSEIFHGIIHLRKNRKLPLKGRDVPGSGQPDPFPVP